MGRAAQELTRQLNEMREKGKKEPAAPAKKRAAAPKAAPPPQAADTQSKAKEPSAPVRQMGLNTAISQRVVCSALKLAIDNATFNTSATAPELAEAKSILKRLQDRGADRVHAD